MKLEMSQDLNYYVVLTPRSDKQFLFLVLAPALRRCRAFDRERCTIAHKLSARASTNLDRKITERPSTLSRRAAARASLRSDGKLHGLTMARNKETLISSSSETEVPRGQLLASWLEANRNIPAASSRHGETGLKNAREFVNVSKASVHEDCETVLKSFKRSLKKLHGRKKRILGDANNEHRRHGHFGALQ